jgi:single-strand DNA-binding protein
MFLKKHLFVTMKLTSWYYSKESRQKMNTVTVAGNLTRDPEVKIFDSGKKVATFSIAVNRRVKEEEYVSYLDVNAWEQLGENCSCLKKGDRVIVAGRLDQRSWEDKEGNKKSKIEITATEVSASLSWATVVITKNSRPDSRGYEESYEATAPREKSNAPREKSNAPKSNSFSNDFSDNEEVISWDE